MNDRPTCPFCQAPWTQAMTLQLERFSSSGGCRCCSSTQDIAAAPALETPDSDLCCETCGKAIYLAPKTVQDQYQH